MKVFRAIHIRKKQIVMGLAGIALLCGAVAVLPPAVTKASAVVSASVERKLPIYCVDTKKPQIAVSFDAAWGADDTDELLRILRENDVKATFFLCGYWVEKYPEEVKKIAADGHDLGNHSATSSYEPNFRRADFSGTAKLPPECQGTYRAGNGAVPPAVRGV